MEMSLAQRLLLIAFDVEKGKPTSQPSLALPYALAGATVMDLLLGHGSQVLAGKVEAGPDTGDPVLDYALSRIRADSKARDVKHWVKKLAGRSANLQGRLLEELLQARVLEERDGKVFGFKVKRYALSDRGARDEAMAAVHDALVGDAPSDQRTVALTALVGAAGLVDRLVSREERGGARQRARAIAKDDPAGKAVNSAVQEVEAAVMAGVIAAIAASSVTSSGHGH